MANDFNILDSTSVNAETDPVTGGIGIQVLGGVTVPLSIERPLARGTLSLVASVTPTRTGAMRIAISPATVASARNADLSDLCAVQDGYLIPIDIPPGTTRTAGGPCFVGVRSLSAVNIYSSSVIEDSAARTWVPSGMTVGSVATTFSGSHSAGGANNPLTSHTHPSIVDCGASWNGHRYWASVTPWIGTGWPASDAYEDPMIFYSDDCETWTAIDRGDGFANLFDARTTLGATYLSSDARLAFDEATSTLHCVWRITNGTSSENLVHLQTTNGTTWVPASGTGNYDTLTFNGSASGTAFKSDDAVDNYTSCISPSIVKVGAMWHMWTCVRTATNKYNKVRHFTSNDGLDWRGGETLPVWWTDDFIGPWHGDVQYDPDTGRFVFTHLLGRGGGAGAPIQNNTLAAFLSVSTDGRNWTLDDCPIRVAGPDTTTVNPRIAYKPASVRVGVNSWRFISSFTTSGGSFVSVSSPVTMTFAKQSQAAPINGVFQMPQGRWYGTKYSVPQFGLIQAQPGWRNLANNAVSVIAGELHARKRAAGSGLIRCGNKCNHSYRLEVLLKPTTANAKIRMVSENIGEAIGINYDFFGGLVNQFKISNSGAVAEHTLTAEWQTWVLTAIEDTSGNIALTLTVDGATVLTDSRTAAQITQSQGVLQIEVSGDANDTDGADFRYAVVSVPEIELLTI